MSIGDELMSRKQELGELLSREEGKPLAEGIGEVHRSAQFFHYYAAEVLRQMGETAASALVARMRQLKVGHALEQGTQIGPVAEARQLQQNLDYLQLAKADGATLVEGGELLALEPAGHYMRPA
eukprot:gene8582-8393_t